MLMEHKECKSKRIKKLHNFIKIIVFFKISCYNNYDTIGEAIKSRHNYAKRK